MTNPWDVPPFPLRGDTNDTLTFAGVGRVTTLWESIEFELSNLCHVFTDRQESDGQRRYGEGNIFAKRLDILSEFACAYFTRHCDQSKEGRFSELREQARHFSKRRHEVAHGIVFDITLVTAFREKLELGSTSPQWAVVAPYYAMRHHDVCGLPYFAYSSVELDYIMRMMRRFFWDIRDFRSGLATDQTRPS